jgi:HEAT repeat protein
MTVGGSVISEVDMALSRADGHQPATERGPDQGGPEDGGPEQLPDPGAVARRRQAVLAGHGRDPGTARRLADDPDPTVRSAALGALWRLGALEGAIVLGALGDTSPVVRRRACALGGRAAATIVPGADVIAGLVAALQDLDPSVVETAAWALGEVGAAGGETAVAELCRVATAHASAVCRESAVAALGAVGAPGTLSVVLGALDDTPNIRRRAAIALAAFDDPAADEGLRRCLGDRDWQVRQAAEELLSDT